MRPRYSPLLALTAALLASACSTGVPPLGDVNLVESHLSGDIGVNMVGLDGAAEGHLSQGYGTTRLQIVLSDDRGAAMHYLQLLSVGDDQPDLEQGVSINLERVFNDDTRLTRRQSREDPLADRELTGLRVLPTLGLQRKVQEVVKVTSQEPGTLGGIRRLDLRRVPGTVKSGEPPAQGEANEPLVQSRRQAIRHRRAV